MFFFGWKLLKIAIRLIMLWMFVHIMYITYDGLRDEGKKADAAVILGTTVNPNGALSERLAQRVNCGLELYKAGRVRKIIVSGGFGKEGHYEGTKMKEFLEANGVPSSDIIVDNVGNNTEATAKNTSEIAVKEKLSSFIVVSQYFHITRTKKFFRKYGMENVIGASPVYFEFRDLYSLPREFLAYYIA